MKLGIHFSNFGEDLLNFIGLESIVIWLFKVVFTYLKDRTSRSNDPSLGRAPTRYRDTTSWQTSGLLIVTIHCNIPSIWNLRWLSRHKRGNLSSSGRQSTTSWGWFFKKTPIHTFYSRDGFFGIVLETICPHVLTIMVSVVITKVILMWSMFFHYENWCYLINPNRKILSSNFKIIHMCTDVVISTCIVS